MYTKEQQERALKEFARLGSVQAVINLSTRNTLYEWNKAVRANKQNHHGSLDKPHVIKNRNINSPSHPRNPDINVKLDAIYRCFSLGEGVEYISKEIDIAAPVSIHGIGSIRNSELQGLWHQKNTSNEKKLILMSILLRNKILLNFRNR